MTHLCEKIISTLPSWRKLNGPNQLMSLQQFVYDVQDQLNPLASEEDLRRIAQQLHSTGEVRLRVGEPPLVEEKRLCYLWSLINKALFTLPSGRNLGLLFLGFEALSRT